MEKIFSIKGMHCNACATIIERSLKDRVMSASADYASETLKVEFDESKIAEHEIKAIVKKAGYELHEKHQVKTDINKTIISWIFGIGAVIILAILYYRYHSYLNSISIPQIGQNTSLLLIFVIGLLTGFHCVSMCGGFVLSYTAKNAINGYKGFSQHLIYGGSKVLSYTIIGALFGLVGSFFSFSPALRGTIAILAGIFMIFYALSMFGFSFFKRFQLKSKLLTTTAAEASSNAKGPFTAPLVIGLLNGLFLACGPLQAMYLYAAGTGSIVSGGLSLLVFGLGTLPVMFIFGILATTISHKTTAKILKISAIIVLILGLIMINRGLALTGSNLTFDSIKTSIAGAGAIASNNVNVINGVQEVHMDVDAGGYSPKSFVLKQNIPVKWIINVKELTSCNNEILLQDYNIDQKLKQGENIIEFTPNKSGTSTFTCWMGMLRGNFIITETGTATSAQIQAATPKSSGSCNMGSGGSCGGSCGGGCGCGGSK